MIVNRIIKVTVDIKTILLINKIHLLNWLNNFSFYIIYIFHPIEIYRTRYYETIQFSIYYYIEAKLRINSYFPFGYVFDISVFVNEIDCIINIDLRDVNWKKNSKTLNIPVRKVGIFEKFEGKKIWSRCSLFS